jgi:DnaJ-class molecular chaperone
MKSSKIKERDPYKILGVDKDVSDEDLKKAYKTKAKLYHPDVTTNEIEKKKLEEKFKDLGWAYEILSDPKKRQQYDLGDTDSFANMNGFPNMEDFLRQAMGKDMGGFHFSFGGNPNVHVHTMNVISTVVNVSLLKALCGGEVTFPIASIGTLKIDIPPGTQPGTTLQVRPKTDKNTQIIINLTIQVELPPNLSPEQLEQLKKILPE